MATQSRTRTWLVALGASAGVALGAAGLAGAATGGSSASTAATPAAAAASTTATPAASAGSATTIASGAAAAPDPAALRQGPGETLLEGDTAAKVEAAAKAAVPGGTVIRVETDAQGAAYEAHVQKADGSAVTLKLDESFAVTATEDGFGAGPGGGHQGPPPAGAQAPSATTPAA